jgi:tripartite-type tricarboxylate transporter receptor subunit TctC
MIHAACRFVYKLSLIAALAVCTLVATSAAQGQSSAAFPEKPIKLIVPYSPGGSADFTARLIAQKMSEGLRQPLVVDNKPGANGIIGADVVAKAAPDGYTLLLAPRELGINPSIYATLPYDTLKSFAWIGLATEGHFVMVVNPSIPAQSFADLIALAKAKPASLSYGSIGIGSIAQLNVEALKQRQGVDILHVPYKGAGPALNATVSGEVALTIAAVPGAIGFIKDGRLRALAVGSPTRLPQFPDVPTLGEVGGGADTFVTTFFGLAAPANTPEPIIAKLNAELRRAVTHPDIVEKLNASGLVPIGSTPEVMASTIADDIARFGTLVKSIGIKPE